MSERTATKTLWTETLLELLYAALEKQSGDSKVLEIIHGLKQKGLGAGYLLHRVRQDLGEEAASRLKKLMLPYSAPVD